MSRTALLGIVDSLARTIHDLKWEPGPTLWSEYVGECNYSAPAQDDKKRIVFEFLDLAARQRQLSMVWDLGANVGEYSRMAATRSGHVVSFDLDQAVVERHFRACAASADRKVLPLVQDLGNPSAPIGWHHAERRSILERGPADATLALALVHHLAIGGNVPLGHVAAFLRDASRYLIVEFVPKEDSQVRRMLAVREDIFPDYTRPGFEEAFSRYFVLVKSQQIAGTVRTMYLMERR